MKRLLAVLLILLIPSVVNAQPFPDLQTAYWQGATITVGTTDLIFNLSSTGDFHVQAAGGAGFSVLQDGSGSIAGNFTMANGKWIGLGSGKGQILFDDSNDEIEILNAQLGVGVSDPDVLCEFLAAAAVQLKLSYDGTDNATFGTDDNGDLTILASGGDISFGDENLLTTGTFGAGAITGTSFVLGDNQSFTFGDNADATITFDGDSLNIVANAVTAGNDLVITGNVGFEEDDPGVLIHATETTLNAGVAQFQYLSNSATSTAGIRIDNADLTANSVGGINLRMMDDTGVIRSGPLIVASKEQLWTTTAGTRDSMLEFWTTLNSTRKQYMTISSDGNISLPVPSQQLDFAGGLLTIQHDGAGGDATIAVTGGTPGDLILDVTGGGDVVVAGGSLGIGVSSFGAQDPDEILKITGSLVFDKTTAASEGNLPAIKHDSISDPGVSNDLVIGTRSNTSEIWLYTGGTSGAADFGTSASALRMTINAIGTTSIGDGGVTNFFSIDATGDVSFNGTANIITDVGIGLTPTANMSGLSIEAGLLTLKETTTPTADTDYIKLYAKSTNELFFQDGAGVEHLLHGDSFSNIWFHAASTVEVAIAAQDTFTKIDSFTIVGNEDDLANVVGSVGTDTLTLSAIAGGVYEISFHASITATGGADKEMVVALGITFATPKDITNVTDDTVTPIVITSVGHDLENGEMVEIEDVLVNTAANGSFIVANRAADTFEIVALDGTATVGNGDYNEGAPTGDITIEYPGNMVIHREVRGADLGAISATAIHVLANSDVLSLYVANLDGVTNLTVGAVSFGAFRIGD